MPSCKRRQTSTFEASRSSLLKLLQDEPERFLDLIGVHIDDEQEQSRSYTPGAETGEWMVVEKQTIPFVPPVKFKTKFTRLPTGSRWQSWAPMGIYVDSQFNVDEGRKEAGEAGGSSRCQATEDATLSSPFYVYPIVKWQFERAHALNHKKIQHFIATEARTLTTDTST